MRLVGQKFKGDAPCAAPWKCTRSFSNDLVVQPVAVLEFRGEFNYPALFMLLFCTILRRNYPARLNGQGLKSLRLFLFFFLSIFFVFRSSRFSLVYSTLVRTISRYYDFNFTEILSFALAFGVLEPGTTAI